MIGFSCFSISVSGARSTNSEQRVQMASTEDSVSVRHFLCWGALFNGRLMRLILFNVAVSHGSTFVFRTTVGAERGANGAAVLGKSMAGILLLFLGGILKNWGGYLISKKGCKQELRKLNVQSLGQGRNIKVKIKKGLAE